MFCTLFFRSSILLVRNSILPFLNSILSFRNSILSFLNSFLSVRNSILPFLNSFLSFRNSFLSFLNSILPFRNLILPYREKKSIFEVILRTFFFPTANQQIIFYLQKRNRNGFVNVFLCEYSCGGLFFEVDVGKKKMFGKQRMK